MSSSEINNPGKGNCAFYGFSIGLIDIIKHEYARYGSSSTFSFFKNQSNDFTISLTEIINFDYFKQSKRLLDEMQQHLRHILFAYRQQNILDSHEALSASNTYVNFAEMVWNYVRNQATSSNFNELAKSEETKNYARKIADRIKKLSKWYPDRREEVVYNQEREAYFHNIIEQAFINDVFVLGNMNQLKIDSLIVRAMSEVTRNYRWGTQTDLNELAHIFNINLHTLINGHAPYTPTDTSRRPIITLDNKHNYHWTTHISFLGSGYLGKTYDVALRDSVLSKQELKEILQSYTHGFMAFVGKRNHMEKAKELIEHCNSNDFDVNDIVRMLSNYLERGKFTHNSSFKKRADYIIARAEYFNEAPDPNTDFVV
jgi:hypothetical protein